MSLDARMQKQLESVLASPYLAANLVSVINAAAGGAAAVGGTGAVQASNGSAGFADSGLVASAGSITTGTWAGTAVAVAHGGTGSTTAAAARTALGLAIGTNVQAHAAQLDTQVAAAPVSITGSQVGGQALASVIAALVALGLGTDNTTT